MSKIKITAWDASKYLENDADLAEYLALAFEDDDPAHIALALQTAAKARNMTEIAQKMGINRRELYRLLNGQTLPPPTAIDNFISAVGIRFVPPEKAALV